MAVAVVLSLAAAGLAAFFLLRDDDGAGTRVATDGGYEVRGPDAAFPDGPPELEVRASDDDFIADLGVGEGKVLSVAAPTQPQRPVEVVLPYDATAVPDGATPAVFYYDEDSDLWLPVETRIDAAAGVLVGTTDHFTNFAAALLDGVLDATETVVNGAATGVDWLAYQVAGATGARAQEPDCGTPPSWVGEVETTYDEGFPLSAPLFACAEAVQGRADVVRLRLAVNRAYGFELSTTPPATSMTIEPTAELSGALGVTFAKHFRSQDGRVIAPGTSTAVLEFDRPTGERAITVDGHMSAQTTLVDAAVLALDVGAAFATGDPTEKVEAFECAVSMIQGAGDVESEDVFLGTWSSVVDDCFEPIGRGIAGDVLGKVGAGITVGLSMGQVGQSFLDRERDLFNGTTVQLAVIPGGATSSGGDLAGRWAGPVPQPRAREYSTVVDLVDSGGQLSATVSYPELECSGTWAQLSRSGATAELQETITDDPGSTDCLPSVDIDVTLLSDGRLRVRYSDSFEALLTRIGAAGPAGGSLDTGPFVADWAGPVDQPGSRPYSMRLQLGVTDGKVAGGVSYPELGCSGLWDEVSRTPTGVTVREVIDHDPQYTCVPELTATLRMDAAGHLLVDGGNWTAVLEAQPD